MDEDLRRRADQVRTEWARTRVTFGSGGWMRWVALMQPYLDACEELRVGGGASLEKAIRYLETRPRVFRSGYLAERIMRFVTRVELSPDDRGRLIAASTIIMNEGATREARQAELLLARLERRPPPRSRRWDWISERAEAR